MKRVRFNYTKKNSDEEKEYNLMVTSAESSKTGYISGIDLNKLNENEIEEVKKIQKEYEEKMKPYIKKGYRQFLKENITETLEQEVTD